MPVVFVCVCLLHCLSCMAFLLLFSQWAIPLCWLISLKMFVFLLFIHIFYFVKCGSDSHFISLINPIGSVHNSKQVRCKMFARAMIIHALTDNQTIKLLSEYSSIQNSNLQRIIRQFPYLFDVKLSANRTNFLLSFADDFMPSNLLCTMRALHMCRFWCIGSSFPCYSFKFENETKNNTHKHTQSSTYNEFIEYWMKIGNKNTKWLNSRFIVS